MVVRWARAVAIAVRTDKWYFDEQQIGVLHQVNVRARFNGSFHYAIVAKIYCSFRERTDEWRVSRLRET
jgi:hypothetical protein